MKAIKKTMQVITAVILFASQSVFAGASSTLKELCNKASGNIVDDFRITGYTNSSAQQDRLSYIYGSNGEVYQMEVETAGNEKQKHQQSIVQKLAKIAYLTGQPVNMCVGTYYSPHIIWIIELEKRS